MLFLTYPALSVTSLLKTNELFGEMSRGIAVVFGVFLMLISLLSYSGVYHLLFYFAGQKINRSFSNTFRFCMLIGIPMAIPSVLGALTDMNMSAMNIDEITPGIIVFTVTAIPAYIFNIVLIIKGGSHLTGSSCWRIFFWLFIAPILLSVAIVGLCFIGYYLFSLVAGS